MINIEIILLVAVILLILVTNILNQKSETKDEFLINLAVLDHVIDDYVQVVYVSKVTILKTMYNLDPTSKVNSIKSFEAKLNELVKDSTLEIIKMLSKQTSKNLRKRFSDKSIALYISNKIRNI